MAGGATPGGRDALGALMHAIEHQLCVRATYNRAQLILAPHILYERKGEPFVDGVVVERDGVRPNEAKLDTFKLGGLRHLAATSEPVQPMMAFSLEDPRYGEKILAAITE